MIIRHDPDATIAVISEGGYSFRRATPEEYQENRKSRLEKEREELEDQLDSINYELENGIQTVPYDGLPLSD